MRNKPKRSYVGKIVQFRWRDSFQGEFEENVSDMDDDVIWSVVGECVRESELFITLTYGRQEGKEHKVHSPISIPWTQIVGPIKVLS